MTGLLTGALAIGGIIFTQRQTNRREMRVRDNEQLRWVREQKCAAHMSFLAEQVQLDQWMMLSTRMGGHGVDEPKVNWFHSFSALLTPVRVFGSRDAAMAASRLCEATINLEGGTVGAMMQVDSLGAAYRRQVQIDLGLE